MADRTAISAAAIREIAYQKLGVQAGETTSDMRFSLEVVRCLGCCALAPVVRIDSDTFGNVDPDALTTALESYA